MQFLSRRAYWVGVIVCTALLLAGCVASPLWVHQPGRFEAPTRSFAVNVPDQWLRFDTEEYTLLSKDGPYLQYIYIQERLVSWPFKFTGKRMQSSMLPLEAAEVVIDEIRSDPAVKKFRLEENKPITIDGNKGFQLVYTYQDQSGYWLRTVYCGFVRADIFYNLRYTAAKRYYFKKDYSTFKKVLASFTQTL
jgi:hypothetical protein